MADKQGNHDNQATDQPLKSSSLRKPLEKMGAWRTRGALMPQASVTLSMFISKHYQHHPPSGEARQNYFPGTPA